MYEQKTKKFTKIVATISDRKCDASFLEQLYAEGMNAVRINTAHQQVEDTLKVIEQVRKVSSKIPIMIDTKGPEVRTREGTVQLEEGSTVTVGVDEEESNSSHINVSYKHFVQEVPVGKTILIDDGLIELEVIEKTDVLVCKVLNSGSFSGKKSINTPNTHLQNLPALTQKDRTYVEFAAQHNIAFIAHSFVRNKEDIKEIQDILDKHKASVQIIAKIENQEGVDNIDEILEHTFGIMVARGDLAMEIPGPRVPIVQKQLIAKARRAQKVCIVATQMLHSMIENPRPTRAEMNDIATAIYDKADAVMLSGETAYGKYPQKAVRVMTKIAEEVECELAGQDLNLEPKETYSIPEFLSSAAVLAADRLDAKAIIVDTTFGTTPRKLTRLRGLRPIYAFCYNKITTRQLALCYGIYSENMQEVNSSEEFVAKATQELLNKNLIIKEDLLVAIAGNFEPKHGASFIEVSTAENFVNKKY